MKIETCAVRRGISEHMPAMKRYALKLTRDRDAADDLVQSTALHAIHRAASFTPGTNLSGWLMTILHNTYVDGIRKSARHGNISRIPIDEIEIPVAATQPSDVYLAELTRAVDGALAKLPPWMLAVLDLVGDGKDYDNAAVALGIPVGTVKSRLWCARRIMTGHLDHMIGAR